MTAATPPLRIRHNPEHLLRMMERKTYRADLDWKEALNKGSTRVVSGRSDEQLEQAEKGYETVRESCQALTSDGKAMLYFIKKDAITVPLVKVQGDEQSSQAFERVRSEFTRRLRDQNKD